MIQTAKITLEKGKSKQLCTHNSGYNVLLKVDAKNSVRVYLGGSNVTIESGFPLEPGEVQPLPKTDFSLFYVIAEKECTVYLLIWS